MADDTSPAAGSNQKKPGSGEGDDESALAKSELGDSDDGGRKGQGGMRAPDKTSDGADPLKPS